jgi:hypothetical protein
VVQDVKEVLVLLVLLEGPALAWSSGAWAQRAVGGHEPCSCDNCAGAGATGPGACPVAPRLVVVGGGWRVAGVGELVRQC